MTTAHKPTYHPAVGSANQGGYRYRTPRLQFSSKDMPGQTRLKYRQFGQNSLEEMAERDLYSELEERELVHKEELAKKQGFIEGPIAEAPVLQITSEPPALAPDQYDDADDTVSSSSSSASNDSDSDDESDDEAELIRELERIKAEREAERLRLAQIEQQKEQKEAEMATINRINPATPDAVSWSLDLSGGIQRVALMHGCVPYGNGKARMNAFGLPDPIPVHREPIYTPRVDLVAKYPTLPNARQFRMANIGFAIQKAAVDKGLAKQFPIILTSGRLV